MKPDRHPDLQLRRRPPQVSGGPDFTPIGNATTIDASTASHAGATGAGVMNPFTATSSQANGSTDDFANKNNATGADGRRNSRATTATWNGSTANTTVAPGSTNAVREAGTSHSRTRPAPTSSRAGRTTPTPPATPATTTSSHPLGVPRPPGERGADERHPERPPQGEHAVDVNIACSWLNVRDVSGPALLGERSHDLSTSYTPTPTASRRARRDGVKLSTRARARAPPTWCPRRRTLAERHATAPAAAPHAGRPWPHIANPADTQATGVSVRCGHRVERRQQQPGDHPGGGLPRSDPRTSSRSASTTR